jgi:hypothetical protein
MPPYGTPPIQPSPPPPVYCTECGCEVYPAAWLCATCGKPLHEPGAMTSCCPYARVTSKNSKPDFIVGEQMFAVLLGVVFAILWIASEMHKYPQKSIDWVGFCILALAGGAELLFWLEVYFDRQ